VKQHVTIEEAVFSLGAAPRLYNEDLGQPDIELRVSSELAVGRIIEKKWQESNYTVQRKLYGVLQIQLDCHKSVARIRLVKTEDINVCNGDLYSVYISDNAVIACSSE
jgi:hypothetical protein